MSRNHKMGRGRSAATGSARSLWRLALGSGFQQPQVTEVHPGPFGRSVENVEEQSGTGLGRINLHNATFYPLKHATENTDDITSTETPAHHRAKPACVEFLPQNIEPIF